MALPVEQPTCPAWCFCVQFVRYIYEAQGVQVAPSQKPWRNPVSRVMTRWQQCLTPGQATTLFCEGGRPGLLWYHWTDKVDGYTARAYIRGAHIFWLSLEVSVRILLTQFYRIYIWGRSMVRCRWWHDTSNAHMLQKLCRTVRRRLLVRCANLLKRFLSGEHPHFLTTAAKLAGVLRNTIFSDQVSPIILKHHSF